MFFFPQVNGVTIAIGRAFLANLFHFQNKGRDPYLSNYDSLHDLHVDKVVVYPFEPLAIDHIAQVQKNIIPALKLAYQNLSYNIVPTVCHKILISQLSVLFFHYLHAHIPMNLPYFIIKDCLHPKNHLSHISSIWCSVDCHILPFGVNLPAHPPPPPPSPPPPPVTALTQWV